MRKYFKLFLIMLLSLSFFSCEDFITPKADNILSEDQLLSNPIHAEGLLLKAYTALPDDYNFATDVASDDAVTNDPTSAFRSMAVGNWRATNNAISQWAYAYQNIFYINKFLSIYEDVIWSSDPNLTAENNAIRNTLHKKRLKGEAYGLRGYYKWLLLQYHGGISEGGQLLGFPIIDEYLTADDNWELPRNTFAACVSSIFADFDIAIANLPKTWADVADGNVTATSGLRFLNRLDGNAAYALKTRVALLAASPAFSASSGVSWESAAVIAGPLLKDLGSLKANGRIFYKDKSNPEIIWNRAEVQKNTWEQNNFPPSLYGYGRTNPSQNLVDAFGMKNGYPITDPVNSTYDGTKPYDNRDPRLNDYIVFNTAPLKATPINTYIGAELNGINALLTSTRSGYYLKKFMIDDKVKLDPGSSVNAGHTYTLVRMTEVLLNYAEAANEAWGPDADPHAYGFTARSLIGDLRKRAGIDQPDAYLLSADAAVLTALIRNERRIELCFEGFRFWDIRRWNDISTMKAPVKGAYITNNGGVYSYVYSNIEERKYTDDMIYGPIPYSETVKYNIDQNKGW